MTEAEAAAAAAIMGLIWAALPDALLAGLEGFAATEVLGHIALHPSAITLPHTASTTTVSPAGNIPPATIKKTDDGQTIRVRKLSPREVQKLETEWGRSFHKQKQKGGFKATDDIYVDADGNYWIGPHGSDYVTEFP